MGLTKRAKAVSALNKMIKRTKEKDGIGSAVTHVKMASIAQSNGGQFNMGRRGIGSSLLQVQLHWIDEMDQVALVRKGKSVNTGSAAHIKNCCGWRRKIPCKNRLGSKPFELTKALR